ncbi:RHO protein signal transduction [Scheffersomyces coipomensis]|uniref:RHO protein signal transduction n=1 Tax=Scheffersomyces coipomensis TaxID=1788519 RepID=UPI00315C66DE
MTTNGSVYICIKQFNARLGDELSLKVGDKVEVLADDSEYNDGWFMGKNLLTNEVGLYPKSFTQILQTLQNPDKSLLRSRSRRVASNNNMNNNNNNSNNTNNNTSGASTPTLKVNQVTDSVEKLDIAGYNGNTTDGLQISQSENNTNASSATHIHKPSHSRNLSTQSLTEDLNPLQAHTWTPQQVSSYFALVLGFDLNIAGKFARHKITGPILFELDLSNLKELEIDSFGTRFEINKEIEKLKQISSRGAKLKASKTNQNLVDSSTTSEEDFQSPTATTPNKFGHEFPFPNNNSDEDKSSTATPPLVNKPAQRNSMLMPSATLTASSSTSSGFYKHHQRKRSQSMDNLTSITPNEQDEDAEETDDSFHNLFTSPRKAPQPPTDSPMNTSYKFGEGGAGSRVQSPGFDYGIYKTRSHASSTLVLSRPSSSVYEQSLSASHKRGVSQASNGNNNNTHHRRNSSILSSSNNTHHKRHSSLFSFLSGNEEKQLNNGSGTNGADRNNTLVKDGPKLTSPVNLKHDPITTPRSNQVPFSPRARKNNGIINIDNSDDKENGRGSPSDLSTVLDIDDAQFSPKKSKSVSYSKPDMPTLKDEKRSASDSPMSSMSSSTTLQPPSATGRLKSLRTVSAQNLKNITASRKSKTSAFQEGIRDISPDEAIKQASYSGWMSKKSGNALTWRSRYFTLHGTRLSYFASLKDKREKGLIDITAHKVIPFSTDSDEFSERSDKYNALIASSTFSGSYCFKIIPPAPGFKKGLTFTQPKTHYFAVETEEDMRGWIKALMTATIDIDDTVPVVSSCSTPTVSLSKAQELLAKAREETKLKDEQLRAQGYIRGGDNSAAANRHHSNGTDDFSQFLNDTTNDFPTSVDSTTSQHDDSTADTSINPPKLSIDTSLKNSPKTPSTPHVGNGHSSLSAPPNGFASPYLLASGLLSPKSNHGSSTTGTPVSRSNSDYFHEPTTIPPQQTLEPPSSASPTTSSTPKSIFSNSNGRILSGSRKKLPAEKLMAYSSDGTGNHSFVIKSKK